MRVPPAIRELVRQRAKCACEFCGVTETDAGGLLTVDHFRPTIQGGTNDPANLFYCCVRCNQYKAASWPDRAEAPMLWNPRETAWADHFLELADARLHPLTVIGEFTLRRLRLNRLPLIAWRRRRKRLEDETRLLATYGDLVQVLTQLRNREARLREEQQAIFAEQQALLRRLLQGE